MEGKSAGEPARSCRINQALWSIVLSGAPEQRDWNLPKDQNPNREKARAIRARQRAIGRELRRMYDDIAQDLRDDSPFQYIGEKKTAVLMWLADPPWRIVHLTDGNLPAIKIDVWKVMFEEGRARPTGCSRSRLGLCSESRGEEHSQ